MKNTRNVPASFVLWTASFAWLSIVSSGSAFAQTLELAIKAEMGKIGQCAAVEIRLEAAAKGSACCSLPGRASFSIWVALPDHREGSGQVILPYCHAPPDGRSVPRSTTGFSQTQLLACPGSLVLFDANSDKCEYAAAMCHLGNALTHWKKYADIRDAHYVPALYNRVGYVDATALTVKAAADLDIARNWKPGSLNDKGKHSGNEKGFRN